MQFELNTHNGTNTTKNNNNNTETQNTTTTPKMAARNGAKNKDGRSDINAKKKVNNRIHLPKFCTLIAPEFTPLGGSQPDAAVVACAAVWMEDEKEEEKREKEEEKREEKEEEEKEAKKDDVTPLPLPPDVLDTALAMLCAPLIVTTHAGDLLGREAYFRCPTAVVHLRTLDTHVLKVLGKMSADMTWGGLSLIVSLEESITELPKDCFKWIALGRLDLRQTSLQSLGGSFLACCFELTSVTFPPSLTEVGGGFLGACYNLQHVDMGHTALQKVGGGFANDCRNLTSVVLPDTVTEVGQWFLVKCNHVVEVTSGSTAVQAAAAEHNTEV